MRTRMADKKNPLKLNALQCKTLVIMQALAHIPQASERNAQGEATIHTLPDPHGNHYHVGNAVVHGRDMAGLYMKPVWNALERKGLARANWPNEITLTRAGIAYDTGIAEQVLHASRGH